MKIEYHKTFKRMLSLFWKNVRFPKKGQNGAKVGGAVGKNQLFCILLKIIYFLIFCMKLKGIKGYKLLQTPFSGKFSKMGKKGPKWSKNRVFGLLRKI